METIEERAREYANQYRRDVHDLKEELPPIEKGCVSKTQLRKRLCVSRPG